MQNLSPPPTAVTGYGGSPVLPVIPETPFAEVEALKTEDLKAKEKAAKTRTRLAELERDLRRGNHQDEIARVEAVRAGKSAPEPAEGPKVEKQIEAAQQELKDIAGVRVQIAQDFYDVWAMNQETYLRQVEEDEKVLTVEALDAIESLDKALRKLVQRKGVYEALKNQDGRYKFRTGRIGAAFRGQTQSFDVILQSLRASLLEGSETAAAQTASPSGSIWEGALFDEE